MQHLYDPQGQPLPPATVEIKTCVVLVTQSGKWAKSVNIESALSWLAGNGAKGKQRIYVAGFKGEAEDINLVTVNSNGQILNPLTTVIIPIGVITHTFKTKKGK